MLFSSITFIILFLPVTLLLYYCCPFTKVKNIILLLASLLFYAWGELKFVFIMIFSITINYGMGLLIGGLSFSSARRKLFLSLGICLNLLILFYFKYLNFAGQIINGIIKTFHMLNFQFEIFQIALPLGISFYTFQSLSYLIDVYRSPVLVQKNILNLGLFISFFPQLIAGPIVRYHDINEQIRERRHSIDMFIQGIERFIIGLSKKVLLANTMAEIVDGILVLPYSSVPSPYLLLVIISGALQIYYDFSGYSDMAIGLGRMFGFKIMENFNYPLAASSPSDFWRRWHISLSTWFRDYLYIPLGGNRKGLARQIFNILVVFTLVGLWHGADFNFIFFGFSCGVLLIVENLMKKKIRRRFTGKGRISLIIQSILAHVYCISIMIVLFIYFRLDLTESFSFYSNLFNFKRNIPVSIDILFLADTRFYIFLTFGVLFAFPWWRKINIPVNTATVSLKYICLFILFILSFCTIATDVYNPFIYFRF
jgi:alginate O-acetyltransferase complex protein AlgI